MEDLIMGLLGRFDKQKETKQSQNTLEQDIQIASDWIVNALQSSGYMAD